MYLAKKKKSVLDTGEKKKKKQKRTKKRRKKKKRKIGSSGIEIEREREGGGGGGVAVDHGITPNVCLFLWPLSSMGLGGISAPLGLLPAFV